MKNILFIVLGLLIASNVYCQNNNDVKISFATVFNAGSIVLEDSVYVIEDGNNLKFEVIKFYLSGFQLQNNDLIVYKEIDSFHLVDLADSASQSFVLKLPNIVSYNKIKFNLGIDSTTNVSGALGGDLDPTKGMYWTWQSGYINFKLEGTCSSCNTPKKNFEFHLGGYQYPYMTLQQIELDTEQKELIQINLDLYKFFSEIDLLEHKHIMSPCEDAVLFTKKLGSCFNIE